MSNPTLKKEDPIHIKIKTEDDEVKELKHKTEKLDYEFCFQISQNW